MESITPIDFKGNNIKVGMTIFIMRTVSCYAKIGDTSFIRPIPRNDWDVLFEYKIIQGDGCLLAKTKGFQITVTEPIDNILSTVSAMKNCVVAIKGLSDKEYN